MEIFKAVIPIAGLGTRFLPLSKVVPKELFSLGDKPLIHYALQELKDSGVQEVVFVVGDNKKFLSDYFKRAPRLEKFLEERGKKELIEQLREAEKLVQGIAISYVSQPKPAGDAHAVLQARKLIGNNACFVLYPDDVIVSQTPCAAQLAQVFKTSQKPIMALSKIPKERISSYGVVEADLLSLPSSPVSWVLHPFFSQFSSL